MTRNMKKAVMICGAAQLIFWSVAGCKCKDKCDPTTQPAKLDGAAFYASHETPASQKFMHAQIASGARADSTLNAIHFDGGKLNSLGNAKIDAMLADDDSAEPVVFYLNTEEGNPAKASMQDSVVAYCKTRGMTQTQMQFKLGPNPATYSPSADLIRTRKKTEAGTGEAGAEAGVGAAMGSEGK